MKKLIITSIAVALIVGGSLFALNKDIPVKEQVKPQATVKQVEKTPETTPEVTGDAKIVETVNSSVEVIEVPQKPLEATKETNSAQQTGTFDVMTAVFYANETMDGMTNDVRPVILSRPHLFTQSNYKTLVDNIRSYLSQYMRHEFEYRIGVYDELKKWANTEPLN